MSMSVNVSTKIWHINWMYYEIQLNVTGSFLTILIAASLEPFVIVHAVRLNAVISLSHIHECHSESISFLSPQYGTWTNAEGQWKQKKGKRHGTSLPETTRYKSVASDFTQFRTWRKYRPYLRVLSVQNQVLVSFWWWRYCLCTLCIKLSCNDHRSYHPLCQKTPLNHHWEEMVLQCREEGAQ